MRWLVHLFLLRWLFRPAPARRRWRDMVLTRGTWPFRISPFRLLPLLALWWMMGCAYLMLAH
jgi:hypothetical protein